MGYVNEITNVEEYIREVQKLVKLYKIEKLKSKIGMINNNKAGNHLKEIKQTCDEIYILINISRKILKIKKLVVDNELNTVEEPKYVIDAVRMLKNTIKSLYNRELGRMESNSIIEIYKRLEKRNQNLNEQVAKLRKSNRKKYSSKITYQDLDEDCAGFLSVLNEMIMDLIDSKLIKNLEKNVGTHYKEQLLLKKYDLLKEINEKYGIKNNIHEEEWKCMTNVYHSEVKDNELIFLNYAKQFIEELEDTIYSKELSEKKEEVKCYVAELERILGFQNVFDVEEKNKSSTYNKNYIKVVKEIPKEDREFYLSKLKKENTFFYRGQNSSYENAEQEFSVIPSLMHNPDVEKNEYAVFQDLLRLDNDAFKGQKNYLDIHKEMQHYCEISRVIDLTTQALTGLFFAVGELLETPNEDPYVFIFSVDKEDIKRPESDGTQIKLALSTIKDDQRKNLGYEIDEFGKSSKGRLDLRKFNKKECVQKLAYAVRKNDGVLDEISEPLKIQNIEFVLPNMNNKRIVAQQGAFIAVGLLDKKGVYYKIKPHLKIPGIEDLMMIKINKYSAYNIKLELEQLGINKAVMYPDVHKLGQYFKQDLYKREFLVGD